MPPLRIVVTSDLRFVEERRQSLENLVSRVRDLSPDVLVVAGNFGEPIENFDQALGLFESLPCQKAAVLGNQDVWHRSGDHTSEQLWSETLPTLLQQRGYVYLELANMIVGRIGICGTIGWYDYSGRDPRLKYTVEQYAELKGLVNFDAQYVNWRWSDQEFSSRLQSEFMLRVETLERDRNVDHILIVTHFPVFADAMLHKPDDPQWNFGTAYAFNLTLGRAIALRMKARTIVSGHIRRGGEWPLTFGPNAFKYRVIERDADAPGLVVVDI